MKGLPNNGLFLIVMRIGYNVMFRIIGTLCSNIHLIDKEINMLIVCACI